MTSKIISPAVALVLALAFASGDALKCYECKSVGAADDECSGEMLKNMAQTPIECSQETMRAWYNKIKEDNTLNQISNVFAIYPNTDLSHQIDLRTPMACVKMSMRVNNQPVTIRTCQTAKTVDVDPCKASREKIAKNKQGILESCDMCETDLCNGSYGLSPKILLTTIVPLLGSILMSLLNKIA